MPARNSENACAGIGAEPGQKCAEKANTDNRDCLSGGDLAAPKDVHGTAKRLAGKRPAGERFWQPDHGIRGRHIVFRVALVRERSDTITANYVLDAAADRIYHAPTLVAEITGLGRKLHPFRPGP